jgi:LysR family glycine cleavage system transcriptional activator
MVLFDERLPAQYAHYLVYPERTQQHAGLALFRDWLLGQAQAYAREEAAATRVELRPSPS